MALVANDAPGLPRPAHDTPDLAGLLGVVAANDEGLRAASAPGAGTLAQGRGFSLAFGLDP